MYDKRETTQQAAERLGLPPEFTAMHEGRHVCIDGRHYNVSCLITDPDCDEIARSRMNLLPPHKTLADRRELCQTENVTLDGQPAMITGAANHFAQVATLRAGGPSFEYAWRTVAHIVATGGRFTS